MINSQTDIAINLCHVEDNLLQTKYLLEEIKNSNINITDEHNIAIIKVLKELNKLICELL